MNPDREGKIRVLIVDDHQIVRQGLRTYLELQDEITVVGEAGDGLEAIDLAVDLKPDVVLMDLVMPHLDGISATRQLKSALPDTAVIALTSFSEDDKVFPAIQAGASSYLLKDVTPEELVETVKAAFRGEIRLHPEVTRKLIQQVAQQPVSPTSSYSETLTEREHDVVRLVAQGLSNRDIAGTLFISEKTVKTHISNILGKFHLEDRTQLAIYAIKNHLVNLE